MKPTLTANKELTVPSVIKFVKFAISRGNRHKLISIHAKVAVLPMNDFGDLSPYLKYIENEKLKVINVSASLNFCREIFQMKV